MSGTNQDAYYWDQGLITVNGQTVGRAESIVARRVSGWDFAFQFGDSIAAEIRNKGIRVTGTIGMAYIDASALKIATGQSETGKTYIDYVNIQVHYAGKTTGQGDRTITISAARLDWELGPHGLEDYARASVDFYAKDIVEEP
jgi:hypothetical protein